MYFPGGQIGRVNLLDLVIVSVKHDLLRSGEVPGDPIDDRVPRARKGENKNRDPEHHADKGGEPVRNFAPACRHERENADDGDHERDHVVLEEVGDRVDAVPRVRGFCIELCKQLVLHCLSCVDGRVAYSSLYAAHATGRRWRCLAESPDSSYRVTRAEYHTFVLAAASVSAALSGCWVMRSRAPPARPRVPTARPRPRRSRTRSRSGRDHAYPLRR